MSENNNETTSENIETTAASHPENDPGKLNGNDAVNQAAEQWKDAASRNIPALELGDTPVPDDTANLRQGPSLHDGLLGYSPCWRLAGRGPGPRYEGPGVHLWPATSHRPRWRKLPDV